MSTNTKEKAKTKAINKEKALNTGRIRGVGPLEYLGLKVIGWKDGTHSLPKKTEGEKWESPKLHKEESAYEEYCSRLWSSLQLNEEKDFARMGELMDSIRIHSAMLRNAKKELAIAERRLLEKVEIQPRPGEENLTEQQIRRRRSRECEAALSSYHENVNKLGGKIRKFAEESSVMLNKIRENDNSIRMICSCAAEHVRQRIDVYWQAALVKHPAKKEMPPVVHVPLNGHAETKYEGLHLACMNRAAELERLLMESLKEEA